MRAFVATAMLLFQLQPVLGVALCSAMGGTDADRMEAGCPMPESGVGRAAYYNEGWSAPNNSHECVFAVACTPPSNVVPSLRPAMVTSPPEFNAPVRPADLVLPTEGRTPPVPPPRS